MNGQKVEYKEVNNVVNKLIIGTDPFMNIMALYIKITKVSEKGDIGFYHIFTRHGGETEFYVGFDRKSRKMYCFLTV